MWFNYTCFSSQFILIDNLLICLSNCLDNISIDNTNNNGDKLSYCIIHLSTLFIPTFC